MEVTAAERTTIYTNISPLAQRVNNYIQTQHSSIAAVAKDIGYSRTTVSRYLTGKYDSNPNDLESKLTDFLTRQTGEAVDLTTPLAKSEGKTWQTPVFFESRDAKAVLGVCQSCQEYIGLGIVVARSGYGKTYALRQYAKLSRVAYIECDDTMSSRDLVEAIERSIGLPNGYGTIWRRVNGIREFFNTNKGYLLIIDEADKLVSKYTQKKMEILRAVFDQSDVGLVIAGEPKLEAQIKTYLVRMANRVDFYASLRGLSPSEVEGYLTDFRIEPEALVELKARACNMQTGCFRLLDRTLSIEEINSTQNKDARIQSLQPFVKNGYIKFSKKHKTLLKQMTEYPMGKNDDAPDGLQMAVKLALDVKIGRRVDYRSVIARALDFRRGAY